MKKILFWTWCLPQTLLGLVIFLFLKITGGVYLTKGYKGVCVVIMDQARFGVSLGQFIFLSKYRDTHIVMHEYGHTIQGFIFGPLYLFAVGIPSITRNIINRCCKYGKQWYYSGYPERGANKLGGVKLEQLL